MVTFEQIEREWGYVVPDEDWILVVEKGEYPSLDTGRRGRHDTLVHYGYRWRKKNGSPGALRWYSAHWTPLQECERCGKVGSPRFVTYRTMQGKRLTLKQCQEIGLSKDFTRGLCGTLCMPCFNVRQAFIRKTEALRQAREELTAARRGLRTFNREERHGTA